MAKWLIILILSFSFFILTFILARLLEKRQISQFTYFELILGIAIGVIAAVTSLNMIKVVYGIIALLVWAIVPIALHYLSLKFKAVRDVYQGKETILINHGKVLEDKLQEVRFTPEDLLSQLRRKNIFQVADVEFAILEPNGELSVYPRKDKQPLTAKTMGLKVSNERVPQTVMLDGEIIDEALTAMGLNRRWLHTELEKLGVAAENVFIAQVDATGQLYIDLFDDAIQVPKPKARQLAYATLQKCYADCQLYALSTQSPEAKKIYAQSADDLKEVINNLEPLLMR